MTHIDVTDFGHPRAAQIQHILERHGIAISALAYYFNPLDPDLERRSQAIEHLKKVIAAAKLLRVPIVGTFAGRDKANTVGANLEEFSRVWPPTRSLASGLAVHIWVLLGMAMWFLLHRTAYGRYLHAVGVNHLAGRLSGVNVTLVVITTYALSGLLAALAGFVLLGYTQNVFLRLGDPYTLPSIAAVVVGGTLLAGGIGG